MSILISVIIFGAIVVIHELGHFFMAKRGGITVLEFAVGMGPKLFSIKRGETVYSIRLFPIGGFCSMLGDDVASNDPNAYNNKPVFVRFKAIAAGVVMNFLLSFVIFTAIASVMGFALPVIGEVIPGFPAETAGLMPGDRILYINDTKVNIYDDIGIVMAMGRDKEIDITVKRGKESFVRRIKPMLGDEGAYLIGFAPQKRSPLISGVYDGLKGNPRASIIETLKVGTFEIAFWIKYIAQSLVKLFTFNVSLSDISGPVGIISSIGETYEATASKGIATIIINMANFLAILSANLGVFNLLPLPALDGGRLVFLIIEAIRRKPIPADKEGLIHMVGFVALIGFAIFVAFNDILRLL